MIFLVFVINGPALSLFGQLRFSELAILIIALLNAPYVQRSISRTEWRLGLLFLLSAVAYLVMDLVNQGIDRATISRVGTYTILCALLFALKWIIGDSKARLIAALTGFSFSFVAVLILNLPVPSANYHIVPWRLGLGAALTLLLCTAIFYFPRHYVLGLLGLIALVAVHLLFNSRNLALITLVVFFIALWTHAVGKRLPEKLKSFNKVKFLIYGGLSVFALYSLIQVIVSLSILPDEVQRKFETQLQNPYGLVAAARPDVATAIYGIAQRPITGFGSSTVSADVERFYASVAAANFLYGDVDRTSFFLQQEHQHGTPSHSHVFGAWVDAGIFAALAWMAVLALCGRVLARIVRYRNAITPLATFAALSLSWDVLFSPGPIRLDVALAITLLLFVDRHLEQEIQTRRLQRQSAQGHGALVR